MANVIEFIYWLAETGKSRSTGLQWRRKCMVETVNVEGKLFVLHEEIIRFWKRAKNVEFAKKTCGTAARKKNKAES